MSVPAAVAAARHHELQVEVHLQLAHSLQWPLRLAPPPSAVAAQATIAALAAAAAAAVAEHALPPLQSTEQQNHDTQIS